MGLDALPKYPEYIETEYQTKHRCDVFRKLNEEEVAGLIVKSSTKSCELDPIDTALFKRHKHLMVPVCTKMINASLEEGVFPSQLKKAVVRPLLKKVGLEIIFKNYRPVSNLSYIGKLIESAACGQIVENAELSGNMEMFQSAYRAGHSTETALLNVREQILEAMDNKKVMCVLLLDLSAAFDTISPEILLNRLRYRFGFGSKVLEWLTTYLTERTQEVCVGESHSDPRKLNQGIPQGSILGPLGFVLYISPLGEICRKHGVSFQGYADDSQNLYAFEPKVDGSREECFRILQQCVTEISKWMATNLLKLNTDKTEFIMFGTSASLQKIPSDITINIGGDEIKPVQSVRNLGFQMDSKLTNRSHINKITSTCIFILKKIARVRKQFDLETVKTVIQALVISRLDYCNSLLLGTTKMDIKKIQRVQNVACRIVCCIRKFDHISIHMAELHWLKVNERIMFKVLCIVFKSLHGAAPLYLQNMFNINSGKTRSRDSLTIVMPRFNSQKALNCTLRYAGAKMWNALPAEIRHICEFDLFKANLKTYLFKKSYPCLN